MRLLAAAFLLTHPTASLQTVGIVGAGPAGLTLAVALNRALPDVAVTIFDRSDSCRPALGGGVQLNSGAAVLARLDPALGAAVAALGQPVRRVRSRTAGGDALLDLDLAAAIRGSDDPNPFVRDIEVESGACHVELDGVKSRGAVLLVDGECWAHVHPHELNVYDLVD